jgi:hypothetical protein
MMSSFQEKNAQKEMMKSCVKSSIIWIKNSQFKKDKKR